jgi:hypothetical protein
MCIQRFLALSLVFVWFSLKYQSVVNCVVGWNKLAVLDIEDPIIETSVSTTGTMKGVHLQETITFSGTRAAEREEIHGIGKGVVMTSGSGEGGEPEMVTYTGEGIGRIYSSGSIKRRVISIILCYTLYSEAVAEQEIIIQKRNKSLIFNV